MDGIADEAVTSVSELFTLVTEDRSRGLDHASTSVAALRLFELLPRHPVVSVAFAIKQLGVSKPTAGRAIEALEKTGVLVETTGKKRDRSWVYQSSSTSCGWARSWRLPGGRSTT